MAAESNPFLRLEDSGKDFPFYNGAPVPVSGRQWLFIIGMVAVGFLAITLPLPWPKGAFGQLLPAILMPAIPLIALARVVPAHWKVIFGKVSGRDLRLMFGFALLNIVVSMSVGAIVNQLGEVAPNGATAQLASLDLKGKITFFAKTIPQLFGEEIITLLPFMALLHLLGARYGISRKRAVIGAWLISSVIFGLLHLPTYGWNLVQCVVVIGSARLVLTLPWIMTKNIWVSTGAHIINDWLLFSVGLLGASLVSQT